MLVAEFVEQTLRMLCEWRSIEILEMNVKEDHIHMILSIPPRLSISEVMGMLKDKTATKLFLLSRRSPIGETIFGVGGIV